jgi:Leucine-rich repeat (LRR) protein
MRNNQIRLLQREIGGMKNLKELHLENNDFSPFQRNLVKKYLVGPEIYF